MKKIMSVLIAAAICLAMFGTAFAAEFNFTDVKTSDWFYNDVKNAVELGLINGKSPTTYAPNDNLTYAEAIKLAACMNQLYNEGEITLESGSPWYMSYVEYCVENEIIDKEYNYTDKATRSGYMGIFAKALPDEALKPINNVPDDSIPDVPSSRTYAPGVYKLYRAGILTGVDEAHNCKPLANIKRSEVAAILTRMMDETKRVEFSMGTEEEQPEEKEPEEKEPEVKEPEVKEPEVKEPEVKEPEVKEPETTEPLAIRTQPALTTAVKINETAKLTVEVEGGKAPYTYQWQVARMIGKQKMFSNLSDKETISGTATAELALTANAANQSEFRCVITDANGESVTSRVVIVKFEESAETNTDNTESSTSSGAKDKFQQGEPVEYRNEDFEMTIESCHYITLAGALELAGRVADGKVNAGDTIYINDANGNFVAETKVIGATMFSKLLDEAQKGDNIGLRIDLDVETWKSKILTGYVASATKGTVSTTTRPSTGMTRPTTGSTAAEEEEESNTTSGGRGSLPTGKSEYID